MQLHHTNWCRMFLGCGSGCEFPRVINWFRTRLYPQVISKEKVFKALVKHSRLQGKEEILQRALKFGYPPNVEYRNDWRSKRFGFTCGDDPDVLKWKLCKQSGKGILLEKALLLLAEQEFEQGQRNGYWVRFLERTVLHELVHWQLSLAGDPSWADHGTGVGAISPDQFEKDAYGSILKQHGKRKVEWIEARRKVRE